MDPEAGDCYYRQFIVDFDQPITLLGRKWAKQVSPTQIVIGSGQDLFPVQACLRIRFKYGNNEDPLSFTPSRNFAKIGNIQVPFAKCNRGKHQHGNTWRNNLLNGTHGGDDGELQTDALGPFQPFRNPIPNEGGYNNLYPLQGSVLDSATTLLLCDGMRERMPIGCLDPYSGQPVASPVIHARGYKLARGNKVHAKLPAFWRAAPFEDPNHSDPDYAKPRVAWPGTCPYEAQLRAYMAHDGQHLCRAYDTALAALSLYNCEGAADDLQMYATEARYGDWRTPPPVSVKGIGSGFYGNRESGNVSRLWSIVGHRNPILQPTIDSIMETGQLLRVCKLPPKSYNPDPWEPGPGSNLTDPVNADDEVEQSQEVIFYWFNAFLAAGEVRRALNLISNECLNPESLSRRKGYIPKFFVTGKNDRPDGSGTHGTPVRVIEKGCGNRDAAPCAAIGIAAHVDPHNRALYLGAACWLLDKPQGRTLLKMENGKLVPDIAALYSAYKDYWDYYQQSDALLSACEIELGI